MQIWLAAIAVFAACSAPATYTPLSPAEPVTSAPGGSATPAAPATAPAPVVETAAFRGAIKPARSDGAPLEGTIRDAATRDPIAGVSIVVTSAASSEKWTMVTDDRGRFVIAKLPIGRYELAVFYGEIAATTSIELVPDKTVAMTIDLHTNATPADENDTDKTGVPK